MALPITVPYTFGSATTAIPLSNLDSDFSTITNAVNGIGNGSVALANVQITGGTIPSANVSGLGTMATQNASNVTITGGTINTVAHTSGTFANASITSLATTFPNNYLSNSSVTIGNTTVSLGSTVTSFGNVTLTNATLSSLATPITNAELQNSTISGVSLGGSLANLTAGTNITFSSGTTYNGSTAITINASGGGSGTVNSGTQYQLGYYASTGTAISGDSNITTDANNNLKLASTATLASANTFGFKNRIINGAMVIDQRNVGASVTITSGGGSIYTVDRWSGFNNTSGSFTVQQQSSSPPVGFNNYAHLTISSTTSPSGTNIAIFVQTIEGYNINDLQWGTANAKPITVSFWVRASATVANFPVLIKGASDTQGYGTLVNISAANTWQYVTISMIGSTSGTWGSSNNSGIAVIFPIGTGSSYQITAGSWQSSPAPYGVSGQTQLISQSGLTIDITGVQFEIGTQATSFDYRDYTRELQMCQRYLPAWRSSSTQDILGNGAASGSNFFSLLSYETAPRVPPTGVVYSSASHFYANQYGSGGGTVSNVTFNSSGAGGIIIVLATTSMTSGNAGNFYLNTTQGYIYGTGCEL